MDTEWNFDDDGQRDGRAETGARWTGVRLVGERRLLTPAELREVEADPAMYRMPGRADILQRLQDADPEGLFGEALRETLPDLEGGIGTGERHAWIILTHATLALQTMSRPDGAAMLAALPALAAALIDAPGPRREAMDVLASSANLEVTCMRGDESPAVPAGALKARRWWQRAA
ncbi:hypothetical protein ACODT4_44275 [Streptomyces sp. 2.9]|uniref:hypothetical protein n=1 Tax=Streptomyces tritrimontium TaxID=3406573 RepID=UPI003BB64C50